MAKSLFRLLSFLIVFALVLTSCGPKTPQDFSSPGPQNQATPQSQSNPESSNAPLNLKIPAPTGSAAEAAARLARQLSEAASPEQAAPVLAEILTWAGVAIYDPAMKRINQPVAPLSKLHLFDFQVYGLAVDYINQGGMSMGELAQALSEASGFSDVNAPIATPTAAPTPKIPKAGEKQTAATPADPTSLSADMLQALFSSWTTKALSGDPTNWEAFTPLFLRALNLLKSPAVDLQYEGYAPGVVRLSTLELALFASAHVRDNSPAPEQLGMMGGGLARLAQGSVCSEWNRSQQAMSGEFGADATKWATGTMLGEGWNFLKGMAGGFAGKLMGGIGTGMGWLLTGISVVAGMTAWEFTIRAEPNPAHYKHDEPNDINAYFIATIKVNEKWPKWFSDCLNSIGTVLPSSDDLSGNIIRWVPIHNLPPHAVIAPDDQNGRMEQHFSKAGEARLKLKMDQEKNGDWETAPIKKDHITIRGELYRNTSMPGASTLITAAMGNIPAAVAPVLSKWADKWFPMKAYGVMNVTYHKIVPMSFTKEGMGGVGWWTATGYNCQGIYGNWTISIFGATNDQGMNMIMDGTITGNLPKGGDGTFSGKLDLSAVVSAAPVIANINLDYSGKLKLGGTEDAPVLIIAGDQTSGKASGAGPTVSISMPLSGPGGAPYGVAIKEDPDRPECK